MTFTALLFCQDFEVDQLKNTPIDGEEKTPQQRVIMFFMCFFFEEQISTFSTTTTYSGKGYLLHIRDSSMGVLQCMERADDNALQCIAVSLYEMRREVNVTLLLGVHCKHNSMHTYCTINYSIILEGVH